MDKVLITGGSHAELPLIDALHRLGYYVISTGNNPDGLGHASADLYVQGDFSDRDLVLRLAEDYSVKGVVSGCNDFAFLSAAYACEKLGLPGHDNFSTASIIHHKDLFRELLRGSGLPSPESIKVSSESELEAACQKIGFPMLVKPVDLTGGKGVRICSSINEAKSALSAAMKATREDHVIAEQMIKGQNHGVSALIKNGKTVFAFFDNEEYYINKYLVSGAYAPADISDEFLEVQDEYLKEEISERGITNIKDLKPVRDGLYIWQGDITTLKCDAIVNAANSGLTGCYSPCHSCIDNCIHTYAGIRLRNSCADIIRKQGHEEQTGLAKITPAYNLPSRYVIHTVGPIVSGALTQQDEDLLRSCYVSCLETALENNVSSIAFCCISTGVFCFPNQRAAEIAVETVEEFRKTKNSNIEVIFNVWKDIDYEIYTRLLG